MAQVDVVLKTSDYGEYLRALARVVEAPEITDWVEDEGNLCMSFVLDFGYLHIDGFTRFCHIVSDSE